MTFTMFLGRLVNLLAFCWDSLLAILNFILSFLALPFSLSGVIPGILYYAIIVVFGASLFKFISSLV